MRKFTVINIESYLTSEDSTDHEYSTQKEWGEQTYAGNALHLVCRLFQQPGFQPRVNGADAIIIVGGWCACCGNGYEPYEAARDKLRHEGFTGRILAAAGGCHWDLKNYQRRENRLEEIEICEVTTASGFDPFTAEKLVAHINN